MKNKNHKNEEEWSQEIDDFEEVRRQKIRQDFFICFNDERDYRTPETIWAKAKYYTGIATRGFELEHSHLEYILKAIEMDYQIQKKTIPKRLDIETDEVNIQKGQFLPAQLLTPKKFYQPGKYPLMPEI